MTVHFSHGVTRSVLLIGKYAIKFPTVRYGWDKFLRGLLSNMCEAQFNVLSDEMHLCPTIWAMWGGWCNVQRRCKPLTDEQWFPLALAHEDTWFGFLADHKRDNFGSLGGRIVLLDYGELT